MNSTLATEPTDTTTEKAAGLPPLEAWSGNDRMRHIPSLDWMIRKIDVEVRRRTDLALGALESAKSDAPSRARLEESLRTVGRALDVLAETARHSRHHHQGGDLSHRLEAALANAGASLRSLDADLIGRRFPYHSFDRSKAEPLYGAVLLTLAHVERSLAIAREIDPRLDERLLEGLVVLGNPVDERMLRPIA